MPSFQSTPSAFVLPVVLLASLACAGGGASDPSPAVAPEAPIADVAPEPVAPASPGVRTQPALWMPVDGNGRCEVTDLTTKKSVATFAGACDSWSISAHPSTPTDVVLVVGKEPAQRVGTSLPNLPEVNGVDAVGFDTTGRVVAMTFDDVEVKEDPKTNATFVMIDGKRVDGSFDTMFGAVVCSTFALEGSEWRALGQPTPVQLYEGMSSPYCTRVDGAPKLAKLYQPGQDETIPNDHRPIETPPDSLDALSDDEYTTWTWLGADLVGKYMEFEGARLQTPFAAQVDGNWTVLEGLDGSGPAQMFLRDGFLLVCADDAAHVYDTQSDYKRVWTAKGQCPVFWPLEG